VIDQEFKSALEAKIEKENNWEVGNCLTNTQVLEKGAIKDKEKIKNYGYLWVRNSHEIFYTMLYFIRIIEKNYM